ncbi:MAG: SSS family solute:Na+ symporter, partial [Verrucomicrobiales bacterium]
MIQRRRQLRADTLVCTKRVVRALILLFSILLPATAIADAPLQWSQLKPLPDENGFAGAFAGVSNDALIVAGGANFPDGYPWDGGKKAWHDSIFVLERPDGDWKKLDQKLPSAVGYGVSAGAYFIGGQDAEQSFASGVRIIYSDGELRFATEAVPDLPSPASMACGAIVNGQLYIAGGSPDAGKSAQKTFQRLSYNNDKMPYWEPLPWPEGAPARILAVAGSIGGKFYLFGGADLGSDEWDKRTYLNDAYEFDPKGDTWRRLADLPRQLTAGPSPAIPSGQSHLLLIGGANRQFVNDQRNARPETNGAGMEHPGFPKKIFAYHTITDTWIEAGELPADSWSPVTTATLQWAVDKKILNIIPTGEIKPGIRSPQILSAVVEPAKRSFGLINWIVVAAYLGGMVLIGYWFSKRNHSTDDFFRGGQRIPSWVAGLSIFATMLSAITFMSIPALAYSTDISWYLAGQTPILIIVPIVIIFYLPFFRKLDITSAYEYIEKRFNLPARLFASASFILFHVGRVAFVLYLPAIALARVSSINVVTCIIIIGALCVLYTVMGGIEAVVWTDAIQAIVLMGGALLCLALVFFNIEGGIGTVWQTSVADHKLFSNLTADFNIKGGTTSFFVLFIAFFFNTLISYTSGQDVVQRYVTTPTEKDAARSLKTTMWMSITGSLVFFSLGLALYAFYKASPSMLDPAMQQNDGILPYFILQNLPVGIAGLIIAAIFAASQSTVSSSLNSVATAYVTDFHARVLRPGNPDEKNLTAARVVVVLLGTIGIILACVMAKSDMRSVFEDFNKVIGLVTGALGGLFALGIFNKRANGSGAFLGALIGFALVTALYFLKAPVSGLLNGFIGFTTCFISGSIL